MVGIVILNYNNWDLNIDCVNSIRKTTEIPYKIYIVDNASTLIKTEKFCDFIKNSSDCELLISEKNRGYSAGNNIGIKKAIEDKCDYILISNNDVIFKNSSIENMCKYLDNNKNYGIVGPKVWLTDGSIQEINMGCKMTISGKYKYLLRKTPLRFISKSFVDRFHANDKDKLKAFDVYAVSGCCFMLSKEAANNLYPLDENVFLYEEENIIGARMEKVNLKTAYVVDSEVIHIGGATAEALSEFAYRCFINSEQYYCKKYLNAKWIQTVPLFFIRMIIGIKHYGINFCKK